MRRTAEEWRTEYYLQRGKTIPPCSLMSDILRDMEELEASIRYLQARLLAAEPILKLEDVEV